MKIMNNFIPIHEFAKLKKTSKQNVYRWIREGKIKKEHIEKAIIEVVRLRISKDAL